MAVTEKSSGNRGKNAYLYKANGHRWTVFGAGAFASATMTILMVLLLLTGLTSRSVANLIADKLATVFPPQIQEFFIQSIGPLGKSLLFNGVLLGQVAVGGLLALLMFWLWPYIENKQTLWRNAFIISTGTWFVVVLVVLPLTEAGLAGANLGSDQILVLVSSFLLFQVYGLALGFFILKMLPPVVTRPAIEDEEGNEIEIGGRASRRRFVVGLSAFFMVALAVGIGAGAFKTKNPSYWVSLGESIEAGEKYTGEVTPVGTFYNVSKNFIDPKVEANGWKLEINGLVEKPISFDYNSIRQLPAVSQAHTLTCISNPVGGKLIGNGEWKGTRLKDLLGQAGVKPGAKKLVFTCADGYTDSITLDKAHDPQTLLVWEMNGAPLTPEHGYPLRALIPDIYGMKNAKWIKEITLVDTEYEGYWQKQGWDNPAVIKTQSSITFPVENAEVRSGERITVRGLAFAGQRGVSKVEVSSDGGKSWQEARVKPALGQNSWQLWHFDWTSQGAGKNVRLQVRATDSSGKLQTSELAEPFPDGSSGYHYIDVRII
jgi:DMSO/TMAO reductase YedYZ molybdopterin-dependent catalytic subunit